MDLLTIRQRLLNIYKDDSSPIMNQIKLFIKDIDKYVDETERSNNTERVISTIQHYENLIAIETKKFIETPTGAKTALDRSYIAQEIMAIQSLLVYYMQNILSKYNNSKVTEGKLLYKYLTLLQSKLTETRGQQEYWRSIMRATSSEVDLIKAKYELKIASIEKGGN